jgi:hypothetical protein
VLKQVHQHFYGTCKMAKKKQITVQLRGAKPRKQQSKRQAQKKAQEVGFIGQALRSLGGLGGTALGGMLGAPAAGSAVGSSLGAAISRWLGAGDYTVGTNSIVKSSLKAASSIPMMHNSGQSVVIRHREFLGEVYSSVNFDVKASYILNPGNSRTFPWLSGIAKNFQEYSFKGLVFHYVPASGNAVSGTSPTLGTVMLQTSYRSTDSAPSTKAEMLNEYCSNEVVPMDTMAHPVECDPKENPFNVQYVRTLAVAPGETQLMYDLGVTHVATSGQLAGNNVLGDLWVTYEVELKKPLVSSNVTTEFVSAMVARSGTITTSTLVDNAIVSGNGGFIIAAPGASGFSGNTMTFAPGQTGDYLISVTLSGNLTSLTWNSSPTLVNCLGKAILPTFSSEVDTQVSGTGLSITTATRLFGISILNQSQVPSFTIPTPTTSGTISDVWIMITPVSWPSV